MPAAPFVEASTVARKQTRTLTEVELEFMQAVWQGGEVSTEDVRRTFAARGRDLSDGSIRKMLSILVRKGYLVRRREGRAFYYRATVGRDEAGGRMARDVLTRAFGGSAALMVAALFDSRSVGKRDIAKIKQLISRREREARR